MNTGDPADDDPADDDPADGHARRAMATSRGPSPGSHAASEVPRFSSQAPHGVPRLCVSAVAVRDERLLLIRRGRPPALGQWSIPGGRVERGETLREAVVREVREETGLDAVCDGFVGWVERVDIEDHFVILDFAVTVLDTHSPVPGDDADEARWVPLEEVTDYDLVDGLADFLAEHGVLRLIS